MSAKFCTLCSKTKPVAEFNKRSNGNPSAYCTLCQGDYSRNHYGVHKKRLNEGRYKRHRDFRDFLRQMREQPCTDCKQIHPHWRMEFDHARGVKAFSIADGARATSMKALMEEIEKCDIVCANCHRDRTHARKTGV